MLNGKPTDLVTLELRKNNQLINKLTTTKSGKYYLQLEASTTMPGSEYILNITKDGTVPKQLNINTYVPPDEFNIFPFVRFDFDLEIVMIETSAKDIVLERPTGKIKWNSKKHKFDFDQVYAKIIQKEEEKIKEDPDKYFKEMAAKKKAEEEAAKKKADELAAQKAKEEANKILQKNLAAMKEALRKQRIADSLAALEAAKAKMEIKKFTKPVSAEDVDIKAFDGTDAYSISIAKKALNSEKRKREYKKASNLASKYETTNILTSLLDVVDEQDKNTQSILPVRKDSYGEGKGK